METKPSRPFQPAADVPQYLLFYLALIVLNFTDAGAQVSSLRVGMPSPTAASLGKYGDIPVSLYTGTPNINIPIYEVKGRALSLPLSLSYHASGVKVEEIAGWVGLGWSLNAGGVITRTVRGLSDELYNQGYYYTASDLNNDNTWQGANQAYLDAVKQEQKDSEPDLFFFNFAGRSGQFVLGAGDTIRAIPYEKIRIDKTISGSDITQWVMTTEEGTRYIFGQIEQTYEQTVVLNVPASANPNRTFTASWYLTRIESPHGKDLIRLGYKTLASPAGHPLRTYKEKKAAIQQSPLFGVIIADLDSFEVQTTSNTQNPVYLEKIISGLDSVRFYTSPRTDFANEHKLDSLKIFTNNQLKRIYLLRYGEFYNGVTRRQRLEKIVEKAANNDSLPPYKFEYNTSQYLPNYDSNGMDYWGFYNGKNSNGTLIPPYENAAFELFLPGADRRPDTTYLKAGALEKITYPTGGYTQFTFEPHDFSKIANQSVTMGYPVYYRYVANAAFGQKDTAAFTIAATPNELTCIEILLNGTGAMLPPGGGLFSTVTLKTTGGTVISQWTSDQLNTKYNETYWLSPGNYWLIAESQYDELNDFHAPAFACIDWETASSANQRFGGGLRIKRIRHHDGVSSANDVILDYQYKITSGGATLSSGVLVNEAKFYGSIANPNPNDNAWIYRSAASRTPLGITHGAHVGYRQVTVLHGANGKYGKAVHQFRAPDTILDNVSFDSNQGNAYNLGGFTSYDWKRGQAINTAQNDSAGAKRQRTDNAYAFIETPASATTKRYRALSMKWIGEDIGVPPANLYHLKPYEIISAWVYQNQETVTYFGPAGTDSVVAAKNFYYTNSNHAQLTRILETNSDGAKRLTSLKYPLDYTNTPTSVDVATIDSLKNKHIHSAVLQKVVRQQKSGQTDSSVYSAMLVKYKKFATNQFLPYEIYEFDSTAFLNLTDSQLFNTTGGTFNKHGQYKRQLTNEQYDVYGNPTQVKDANGISTTAIFGYNASLPVARIGNATPSQAAVLVFDDNNTAGWSGGLGTWVVVNGAYQQTDSLPNSITQPQRYNNLTLDDAVLEADVRFDNVTKPQRLAICKYIDGSNVVRFVLRRETSNPVVRIYAQKGSSTKIVDAAKTFNAKQWYHLRGEIQGSTARLYLDGELLLTVTDPTIDHGLGKIGLGSELSQASFDNVRFYPLTALGFSGSYEAKHLAFNTLTEENGLSQRFTHDNFGRLKTAQDALGNLTQQMSYYYASPISASNANYIKTTLATNAVLHLRNHDFENGVGSAPDFWSTLGTAGSGQATWDNTVSYSGKKSLKAYIPSPPGSSDRVLWTSFYYDEKVSSKETYRMEVWVKTANGYNGNAKFVLWFHDAAHGFTESQTIPIPAGDREWTKYTFDFTPASATDHLYTIHLDFPSDNLYKGTVWFDRANFYELNTTKTFADGLGRGVQTAQYLGSNSSVQTATIYDNLSRVSKATKAFLSADTLFTKAYDPGATEKYPPIDSANTWYSSGAQKHPAYFEGSWSDPTKYDTAPYAFSETAYYNDPLDRAQKQAAPGAAFRMGTGREVKFHYLGNAANDSLAYSANTLLKQRRIDENNNSVSSFTDNFGNTVATIVDSGGLTFRTTFKYDVMGNLFASRAPRLPTTGDSTKYFYTTLNLLRKKISPDAGTTEYLYDPNGNLRLVKDANGVAGSYFIYYKYDAFNRKTEEGKVNSLASFRQDSANIASFPMTTGHSVTVIYQYDGTGSLSLSGQRNLRGRLSAMQYASPRFTSRQGYLYYSYDNNGRVEWIEQRLPKSNTDDSNGTLIVRINYEYDGLGKITKTYYRRIFPTGISGDAFYTWYDYDALGRLEKVFTNVVDVKIDSIAAQYAYWPSGQVRRLVLGNNLQGVDYLYNSRDWLTQINHQNLYYTQDPGGDGGGGSLLKPDRFGQIIGYDQQQQIANGAADFAAQYNGNISWTIHNTHTNINPVGSGITGWVYKYDKANRLKKANWGHWDGAAWAASLRYDLTGPTSPDYLIEYDANGNLKKMIRYNDNSVATNMTYNYTANTNRLHQVLGLNGQGANNYTYDANGNMIKDIVKLGSANTISYDYRNLPYKAPTTSGTVDFDYDGNGRRISKNTLVYVPGADGKTLAVYKDDGTLLYWNIWGLDLVGQQFWKQ